jgi:hypothetical protein
MRMWERISAWAEDLGISSAVICQRLNTMGWDAERALSTPLRKGGNPKGVTYKNVQQYTHNGKTMGLSDWAKELEVKRATLTSRLYCGWPIERVLSKH